MNWMIALLISVAVGALVGFFVYRKDKANIAKTINVSLATMRAIVVAALLMLLLSPFITVTTLLEKKPALALLVDRSTSMQMHFADSTAYETTVEKWVDQLAQKYDVSIYGIGSGLVKDSVWSTNYRQTDISQSLFLLQQVLNNDIPKQVLLISDGIYNIGANPSQQIFATPYKINTLVVGDTTSPVDVGVQNVLVNKMVSYQAVFECLIDVFAYQVQGQKVDVKLLHNNQVLHQRVQTISKVQEVFSIPLQLKANQKGVQKYSVVIEPLSQEKNTLNNRYDFYVDVIDQQIKVAIVAQAPHPDIVTIQKSFKDLPQFQTKLLKQINSNDLQEFDVFVAHNPSAALAKTLRQAEKSAFYILGNNIGNDVYASLDISLVGNRVVNNDILPLLNNGFSLFQLPEQLPNVISKLTPLQGSMVNWNDPINTLMYQKIGQVITQNPLWIFKHFPKHKEAYLFGEGLWRWSMYEYKNTKKDEVVPQLVKQSVQQVYTQHKEKALVIYSDKSQYTIYEKIAIYGLLKNEMGEVVNDPAIELVYQPKVDGMPATMERIANSYKADLGFLPVGSYTVTANVQYNGKLQQASLNIEVADFDLESLNATADYSMMKGLAANTGGQTFLWEQGQDMMTQLLQDSDAAVVLQQKVEEKELVDFKWMFALIILLLSVEWFVRKYYNI